MTVSHLWAPITEIDGDPWKLTGRELLALKRVWDTHRNMLGESEALT